jgi:hypothetical protein
MIKGTLFVFAAVFWKQRRGFFILVLLGCCCWLVVDE